MPDPNILEEIIDHVTLLHIKQGDASGLETGKSNLVREMKLWRDCSHHQCLVS